VVGGKEVVVLSSCRSFALFHAKSINHLVNVRSSSGNHAINFASISGWFYKVFDGEKYGKWGKLENVIKHELKML
jgi:hypothetical protein